MKVRPWNITARPRRIRAYLALFALGLTVPLIALAAFALTRMASFEETQIQRRVLRVAEDVSADVDRELYRALVTLETLSTSAELKRGDYRAFHAQALLALKRKGTAIVLLDRSNQELVDTWKDYGAELPRTGDPTTAQRVFETGRPQVSNLFTGTITADPVFNVEVPVADQDGTARYVLVMSFEASIIADVLRGANLEPGWIAGVTDNNGVILARSESHEEFVGKPLPPELLEQSRARRGAYPAVNVAGEPIVRATTRSGFADWLISATVPAAAVEAPRRRSYEFAGVLLLSALTLGGALAYLFGMLMTHPLDQATRAAHLVGRGEQVAASPSGLVEADVLIEALSNASAELTRRQEHAVFLMRELAHRAKNQLAVVKGMAFQTAKQSDSLDDFLQQFEHRLQGLAQSQDVLVRQNWKGAWLKDLAQAQLEPFAAGERAELNGPELFLDANAVQNIGFALHELATNASKHGALSTAEGRIRVAWNRLDDGRIALDWIERNGPAVGTPSRKGFGHRVIMELVPHALEGSAKVDFPPEGIRWHLEIPGDHAL